MLSESVKQKAIKGAVNGSILAIAGTVLYGNGNCRI